jgi:hypothetical protein
MSSKFKKMFFIYFVAFFISSILPICSFAFDTNAMAKKCERAIHSEFDDLQTDKYGNMEGSKVKYVNTSAVGYIPPGGIPKYAKFHVLLISIGVDEYQSRSKFPKLHTGSIYCIVDNSNRIVGIEDK